MRRKYPASIVEVAQKMNRSLALGKGLGLDAEGLACLAAIGVNDLVQQKAAEFLRLQAVRHAAAFGTRFAHNAPDRPTESTGAASTVVPIGFRRAGDEAAGQPSGTRQHARKTQRTSKSPTEIDIEAAFQRAMDICQPPRNKTKLADRVRTCADK